MQDWRSYAFAMILKTRQTRNLWNFHILARFEDIFESRGWIPNLISSSTMLDEAMVGVKYCTKAICLGVVCQVTWILAFFSLSVKLLNLSILLIPTSVRSPLRNTMCRPCYIRVKARFGFDVIGDANLCDGLTSGCTTREGRIPVKKKKYDSVINTESLPLRYGRNGFPRANFTKIRSYWVGVHSTGHRLFYKVRVD